MITVSGGIAGLDNTANMMVPVLSPAIATSAQYMAPGAMAVFTLPMDKLIPDSHSIFRLGQETAQFGGLYDAGGTPIHRAVTSSASPSAITMPDTHYAFSRPLPVMAAAVRRGFREPIIARSFTEMRWNTAATAPCSDPTALRKSSIQTAARRMRPPVVPGGTNHIMASFASRPPSNNTLNFPVLSNKEQNRPQVGQGSTTVSAWV